MCINEYIHSVVPEGTDISSLPRIKHEFCTQLSRVGFLSNFKLNETITNRIFHSLTKQLYN